MMLGDLAGWIAENKGTLLTIASAIAGLIWKSIQAWLRQKDNEKLSLQVETGLKAVKGLTTAIEAAADKRIEAVPDNAQGIKEKVSEILPASTAAGQLVHQAAQEAKAQVMTMTKYNG